MVRRTPSSQSTAIPRWLLVAALPGWACVDGPGADSSLPDADYELYVQNVQPVFERRCSERSCHGDGGRPLSLYSPGRHRLDPVSEDLGDSLGPEELRWNFDRSRGFLVFAASAESCELVSKPLAVDAGGVGHGAGTVFTTTVDDEYLDILDWVEDAMGGGPP